MNNPENQPQRSVPKSASLLFELHDPAPLEFLMVAACHSLWVSIPFLLRLACTSFLAVLHAVFPTRLLCSLPSLGFRLHRFLLSHHFFSLVSIRPQVHPCGRSDHTPHRTEPSFL